MGLLLKPVPEEPNLCRDGQEGYCAPAVRYLNEYLEGGDIARKAAKYAKHLHRRRHRVAHQYARLSRWP